MKTKAAVLLSVFFVAANGFGLNTDTKKFFHTDPNPAAALPANKVYPQGQLFPFSFSTSQAESHAAVQPSIIKMPGQPADAEKSALRGRYDVYAALIAGAGSILISTTPEQQQSLSGKEYLKSCTEVSRELNGPLKLGMVFLSGTPKKDITLTLIDAPKTASVVMSGFAYNNCRYVFVINHGDKPVEAMVGGLVYGSGVTIEELFTVSEKFTAPEGDFAIKLEPLEFKAFKIYNVTP